MTLLRPGDPFPTLPVAAAGSDALVLPDYLADHYGVVLFNRGAWCPFCTAQLRGFQRSQEALREAGARVVSLSVDDEPTTLEVVEKHGLTFPVGHSADAAAVSEATGAFVDPKGGFLQATGFVLDRKGTVLLSAYSSGAIGRVVAEDVVGFVTHVRSRAEQAA